MSRRHPSIPTLAAVAVASLGSLLVAIGARSPHTHANLDLGFRAAYVRTAPSFVGPPGPLVPMGEEPALAGGDQVARGRALYYGAMCVSCHGLGAEGGLVGPPLLGFSVEEVRDATSEGPEGMPQFRLTQEQVRAIVAFLNAP